LPTNKAFLFARARADVPLAEFVRWFAGPYAEALRAAHLPLRRCVLNICDVVPKYRIAPFISKSGVERPAYDVVVELWFKDENVPPQSETSLADSLSGGLMDAWRTTCLAGLNGRAERLHTYFVHEKVLYEPPPGSPVDIKFMALGRWMDHLTDEEGRSRWTEHAKLVPRVHVGVNRYVQNWVTAVMPEDAPPVTGIAELHFPSVQSLGDDFYSSAQGQEEIRQDVSRFTKSAATLCVREQVIFEVSEGIGT
jgi:hypothetical protein